jgi:hypothetical protein
MHMGIHWNPEEALRATREPRRRGSSSSLAAKFPGVPLNVFPSERRISNLLLIAFIWSSAGLVGGAVGVGLIG